MDLKVSENPLSQMPSAASHASHLFDHPPEKYVLPHLDCLDHKDYMLDHSVDRVEHEELLEYRNMLHMTSRFKLSHVNRLRDKFRLFETERGAVGFNRIGGLMRACGLKVSDVEGLRIAKQFKLPKKGKVQFSEFLVMMGKHLPELDPSLDSQTSLSVVGQVDRRELRKAFKVFDKEGAGRISTRLLRVVVTYLGEPLGEEEIERMIIESDPRGEGLVNINQFVEFLCGPASRPESPDDTTDGEQPKGIQRDKKPPVYEEKIDQEASRRSDGSISAESSYESLLEEDIDEQPAAFAPKVSIINP